MGGDFGRGVIVRSSYTIHDSFTLVQSVTHVGFSNLLNANSCGFALLLAECGAGCDHL
jgi:hypothetical protein